MQHAIGIALLAVGGVFAVLGLFLTRGSRRAYSVAQSPKRMLVNITGQPYVDLGGTLVNSPPLRAPLTERACTGWRVSLEEEDSSGETTTWPEVWSQARFGDMEIQYDDTMTDPGRSMPVGGVAKIAGEAVEIDAKVPLLAGHLMRVDPTAETVARLAVFGLPEVLVERVTRYPQSYRVSETHLTSGDYVRGYQQTTRLDPRVPFTLVPFSQEEIQGFGCGCVAMFAFGFAALAALLGIVQLL